MIPSTCSDPETSRQLDQTVSHLHNITSTGVHLVAIPTGHVDRDASTDTLSIDDDFRALQQRVRANPIERCLGVDPETSFRGDAFRFAVSVQVEEKLSASRDSARNIQGIVGLPSVRKHKDVAVDAFPKHSGEG